MLEKQFTEIPLVMFCVYKIYYCMYSWIDIYVLKLILQHQFILTVADENGVHLWAVFVNYV